VPWILLSDDGVLRKLPTSTAQPRRHARQLLFPVSVVLIAGAVVSSTVGAGPTRLSGVGGARAIAAGGFHTCAITSRDGLKCWGGNFDGQLGDGSLTDRNRPAWVSELHTGVYAVAAGRVHTCAVTTGGRIECWGWNEYGRLGDGTTTTRLRPVEVVGHQSSVRAIAMGWRHTCALTDEGAAACWGWNESGQLGDGTTTWHSTPTPVTGLDSGVRMITAGYRHTCALMNGGAVECWGGNDYGQLGDGTTVERWTPSVVPGLESGVESISAGSLHTCALTSGDEVECWGRNEEGELGDGTSTPRAGPVIVSGLHAPVREIAAGGFHTCVLSVSGSVECWGWNLAGALGDGTRKEHHQPVVVSSLPNGVQAIAAGSFHTCALKRSGLVWCWGDNTGGELGDGTTTARLRPVPVLDLGVPAARLSVRVLGRGQAVFAGGLCSRACTLFRTRGSTVVLTAKASQGWRFSDWRGACASRQRRCTVRLSRNRTASAHFVRG
jgi:alpha-tubulin suppressor-like RCC1 family protein